MTSWASPWIRYDSLSAAESQRGYYTHDVQLSELWMRRLLSSVVSLLLTETCSEPSANTHSAAHLRSWMVKTDFLLLCIAENWWCLCLKTTFSFIGCGFLILLMPVHQRRCDKDDDWFMVDCLCVSIFSFQHKNCKCITHLERWYIKVDKMSYCIFYPLFNPQDMLQYCISHYIFEL